MASISIPYSISFRSAIKQPSNLTRTSLLPPTRSNSNEISPPISSIRTGAKNSSSAVGRNTTRTGNEPMNIDNLKRFFDLNVGNWSGSFHQFDADGNLMQKINTKLAASTYGDGELMSLIQTLYTKQPPSGTSIAGYDEEPEWAEYKIKETNIFTADQYQQIGFFSNERAFSLSYQTAGMLETVLRQGVLGEDDTGEESPKNLKLPSRRPAIVCENCLYSQEKDRRARAFHVMDSRGVLEMLLMFVEDKDSGVLFPPFLDNDEDSTNRVVPFLGKWKGHSITKRSGVYGSTIAKADTVAILEMDENNQLVQDITSTSGGQEVTTNVHWTGTMSHNLVIFDGGYQFTFLPRGMYVGCPCEIAKSVAESKSFHLEFGWLENPGKRQRLVRTYDVQGLAVSSTYFSEIKL